jgi:hypothetical protein
MEQFWCKHIREFVSADWGKPETAFKGRTDPRDIDVVTYRKQVSPHCIMGTICLVWESRFHKLQTLTHYSFKSLHSETLLAVRDMRASRCTVGLLQRINKALTNCCILSKHSYRVTDKNPRNFLTTTLFNFLDLVSISWSVCLSVPNSVEIYDTGLRLSFLSLKIWLRVLVSWFIGYSPLMYFFLKTRKTIPIYLSIFEKKEYPLLYINA